MAGPPGAGMCHVPVPREHRVAAVLPGRAVRRNGFRRTSRASFSPGGVAGLKPGTPARRHPRSRSHSRALHPRDIAACHPAIAPLSRRIPLAPHRRQRPRLTRRSPSRLLRPPTCLGMTMGCLARRPMCPKSPACRVAGPLERRRNAIVPTVLAGVRQGNESLALVRLGPASADRGATVVTSRRCHGIGAGESWCRW